jgi:hypothetical protein
MEQRRRSTPAAELRWRCGCGPVRQGRRRLRARDPCAGGAGDERRRDEGEELFTGDEELRAADNGAAAGSSWRRHAREGREVQSMNECARVRAGALR